MAQERKREINVPLKGIGCGQGGSNLIVSGNKLGLFEQIAAINTTTADDMLLPESNQILCLNEDNPKRGAGKDAFKGAQLFADNIHIVKERLGLIFGSGSADAFYMLTASLGGGSGNGIVNFLAQMLKKAMGEDPLPVLGLMTLPEDSFVEPRAARNSLMALEEMSTKRIFDSLFIIDNNKVYEKVRSGEPLSKINERIWKPIARTLSYVGRKSNATMDVEDFEALIRTGRCAAIFEAVIPGEVNDPAELREHIFKSWSNDKHFYSNEHSNPHRILDGSYPFGFGLLIGAHSTLLDKKRSLFEGLYGEMSELLSNPMTYRGFVPDDSLGTNQIRVITILTGLPYPVERIQEIAEVAKQAAKAIIDDTPSFLDGLDKNVLVGKQKVKQSSISSFSMMGLMEEAATENVKQDEDLFDSSIFAKSKSKPHKKKGLNFG
ncbi:MAG: cell division GTPase [Clostridia bacterium]